MGDVFVLDGLSDPAPDRASDAAVGAVRELLLCFLSGTLVDGEAAFVDDSETFAEAGVFG